MKQSLRIEVLALALVGGLAAQTAAGPIIFDNSTRMDYQTIRGAQDSALAAITVFAAIDIAQIGVMTDLDGDGDIKFLIFDLTTDALLYSTAGQSFTDDGLTFKVSSVIPNFTLLPGVTYGIGGIATVGGQWGGNNASGHSPFTQNGITASDDQNGNVLNYASPYLDGDGGAMIIVELRAPDSNLVSDPVSTLLLLGLGLAGLSAWRKRWQ